MATTQLIFQENLASNVNNGDVVYYSTLSDLGGFKTQLDESSITKLGTILNVHNNVIIVDLTENNPIPTQNDYIFISKDEEVNVNSLKGYFAEVKMKNTSTDKAELFRVTLGFSESSK